MKSVIKTDHNNNRKIPDAHSYITTCLDSLKYFKIKETECCSCVCLKETFGTNVQTDIKLHVQRTEPHQNCFIKSHNAMHTSAFCYKVYKKQTQL